MLGGKMLYDIYKCIFYKYINKSNPRTLYSLIETMELITTQSIFPKNL